MGLEIVGEAADAEQGQEVVFRLKPDIVLCDIRMGEVDGLALAQAIRDKLPQTKIIIISGYSEFEYAKRAIHIGVQEFVMKPIADEEFYQVIKSTTDLIHEEKFNQHVIAKSQFEMEINAMIDMKKMQFPYERYLRSFVLGESQLIGLCVLMYDDQNYIFSDYNSEDESDSLSHMIYGLFYDRDRCLSSKLS